MRFPGTTRRFAIQQFHHKVWDVATLACWRFRESVTLTMFRMPAACRTPAPRAGISARKCAFAAHLGAITFTATTRVVPGASQR